MRSKAEALHPSEDSCRLAEVIKQPLTPRHSATGVETCASENESIPIVRPGETTRAVPPVDKEREGLLGQRSAV
jgi:hypothetical protein